MDEHASTLLTNRHGGYAWLAAQPESRYQGVFFRLGDTLFRTVAHLGINQPLRGITNMLWGVQREYETMRQRLTMPAGTNALLVELSTPVPVELVFDCKNINDNREWGREYAIARAGNTLVITFRKRNDARDDNRVHDKEYDLHLALAGEHIEFFPVQQWIEHRYAYDESRKSQPWSRWVFNAGTVHAQSFVIAAAHSKAQAVREAQQVLRARMRLVHHDVQHVEKTIRHVPLQNKKLDLAYQCARHALDALVVDNKELVAGYPWFYQQWTRDALVSSKALALIGHHALAKKLVQHFAAQKELFTRPGSQLHAADAAGWIAMRMHDLASLFTAKEKEKVLAGLQKHYQQLHFDQGLVVHGAHETWMDSEPREGARIEVQALATTLAQTLGKHDTVHALRHRVRETFWNGTFLHDGLNDATIRPNVFIAAYAYPDLLSREEWEKCFNTILPKLWLSWGGLATIDKNDPSFHDAHTGEDPASYHHGDSWFWLNNLAALVLHRTNQAKYKSYINQILEASSHEILELGAIGHHAELSSARALSSHGCVSQAWSAAMFIELCHELGS